MVLTTDARKVLLQNPKRPRYANEQGGLFWVVEHDGGLYQLEASRLVEYHEVTPTPGKGEVEILSAGVY